MMKYPLSDFDFEFLSEQVLNRGANLRFRAKGKSMQPVVYEGDIVNIEPVTDRKIRLGDIIFYRNYSDRMVLHRVIKRKSLKHNYIFQIRGDADFSSEEVPIERIFGRLKSLERQGRKINITCNLGRIYSLSYVIIYRLLLKLRQQASIILRLVQSFKIYRLFIRKIFDPDVSYSWKQQDDNRYLLQAKHKNKVIAQVTVNFFGENVYPYGWWIFGLAVKWPYRGLGIANSLIEKICDFASERNAYDIKVFCFLDNNPAVRLYKKLGFQKINMSDIENQLSKDSVSLKRKIIIMSKALRRNQ